MLQLDITPDAEIPFFNQRTTLDGVDYDFAFTWNARTSLWYVTVATVAGELLCQSQALRHGRDLLSRCHSLNKPPGVLFCWVTTPADLSSPKLGDLGARAGVYYLTAAEVG